MPFDKNEFLRGAAAASILALTLALPQPTWAENIRDAVQRSFANSDARKVAIASISAQNRSVAIAQGERGVTVDLSAEAAIEQMNGDTEYS